MRGACRLTSSTARRVAPRVGQVHLGAGVGERPDLAVQALRVGRRCRRPTTTTGCRTPDSAGASSAAGSGSAPWPSTTSSSSTAGLRVGGGAGEVLQPQRRVDHRVRPAGGVGVVAEVDEGVSASGAPSSPVAMIIASLARVPPTNSPRRQRPPDGAAADADHRPRRHLAAQPAQHRLGRLGEVGLAGAEQRELDRGAERRRRSPRSRPRPRARAAWRPRRPARRRRRRRAAAAPPGWPARRPRRTGRGRRRRARASRRRRRGRAAPAPAGSRCRRRRRCRPARAGRRWRSPSPRPPTTAVPQSGPITSSPRSAAARLSATSCSTRHVVAEDHHVVAGVDGVHRLDERVGARAPRPARSRRPVRAQRGAGGPRRRLLARCRCRGGARTRRARASTPASAGVERAVVGEPDARRPCRWASPRAGTSKPISVEHLDVERGGHRDLRGRDARRRPATVRLTWSSVTESAYAPAAELDVRRSCGHPLQIGDERQARALEQAAARRVPDPSQRRRPSAPRRRCPSAASQAANSGITSPCIAQSSSVADSSVVVARQRAGPPRRRRASPPRPRGAPPASRTARRRRTA